MLCGSRDNRNSFVRVFHFPHILGHHRKHHQIGDKEFEGLEATVEPVVQSRPANNRLLQRDIVGVEGKVVLIDREVEGVAKFHIQSSLIVSLIDIHFYD